MKVFVCGDIHGNVDYGKIKKFREVMKEYLTLEDYLIVCGDFGLFWTNEKENQYMLNKVYIDFPCTILWIDGNHENFNAIYSYPIEEFKGGKVHRISDRILHLQRGEIFELDENFKFFAFGGAKSTDRGYEFGESKYWWKEELPTTEEIDNGIDNLGKHNNKVDYIFTHDCDKNILINNFGINRKTDESFSLFLEYISDFVEFKHWYFGHHHIDKTVDKYSCLYNDIVILRGNF